MQAEVAPQPTLASFWASPRSAAKRAFMRALLGEASAVAVAVANNVRVLEAA
jgi:hypothetical protein